MLLEITGTFPGTMDTMLHGSKRRLGEVKIESSVYSKPQARAEFERFINTTDLPEGEG